MSHSSAINISYMKIVLFLLKQLENGCKTIIFKKAQLLAASNIPLFMCRL